MKEHVAYLELRLAECEARPELHYYQCAAYRLHLAVAREVDHSGRYLALLERVGNMYEITRAEWLDRYYNRLRLHHLLGDDRLVRAAATDYGPVAQAASHAEVLSLIGAVHEQASKLRQAADFSLIALSRLVIALMEWVTERAPGRRAEKLDDVKARWREMRARDPGCSWQRIATYPPYRDRIPFDEGRLQTIGSWLEMAVGCCDDEASGAVDVTPYLRRCEAPLADVSDILAQLGSGDEPAAVPSAVQAALGYHLTFASLDQRDRGLAKTLALYQRIFAIEREAGNAATFHRMLAEADIICELPRLREIEFAEHCLAHCQGLAQPHVEHHYESLIAALRRSRSPTEVEHELCVHNEFFSVEFAWSDILLQYMTRAIEAVIAYDLNRSDDSHQAVIKSYRFVCRFFAKDWAAMLANPRVSDYLRCILFPVGHERMADVEARGGAYYGEVGLSRIGLVREAAIAHAIRQAQKGSFASGEEMRVYATALVDQGRFATAADMGHYLTTLFEQLVAGEGDFELGPSSHHKVVMWGVPVHIDDLADVHVAPPRPRVELS